MIRGLCLSKVSRYKMKFYDWKIASLKFQCDLNTLFCESQGVGCRIVLPWHRFWYLFSLRQVGVFWDMNFIVTWLSCELFLTTLKNRKLLNLQLLLYISASDTVFFSERVDLETFMYHASKKIIDWKTSAILKLKCNNHIPSHWCFFSGRSAHLYNWIKATNNITIE